MKCRHKRKTIRKSYQNYASSGSTKATARLINSSNQQFGIAFSSVCKTAWAKITLDKAVPSGWRQMLR
ncbi:DUF2690 domain-containing protein [Bacillus sp. WMMC1349]|uniref:DUF2690 domain-containing protein n=1 Tax=Bacillus sp. WMMC1349 TaxID=2736254 RepID=UPI001C1311A2